MKRFGIEQFTLGVLLIVVALGGLMQGCASAPVVKHPCGVPPCPGDPTYLPPPAGASASETTGNVADPLPPPQDPPGGGLLRSDLLNALARAQQGGDTIGAKCWASALALVDSIHPPALGLHGVASAIEETRLIQRATANPLLEQAHVDCAPVYVDAHFIAVKLGLGAAGLKLP